MSRHVYNKKKLIISIRMPSPTLDHIERNTSEDNMFNSIMNLFRSRRKNNSNADKIFKYKHIYLIYACITKYNSSHEN